MSLAFVRWIHRGPVNSPHKWPVTQKMFSSDDVIMRWMPLDIADDNFKLVQVIYRQEAITWVQIHVVI